MGSEQSNPEDVSTDKKLTYEFENQEENEALVTSVIKDFENYENNEQPVVSTEKIDTHDSRHLYSDGNTHGPDAMGHEGGGKEDGDSETVKDTENEAVSDT